MPDTKTPGMKPGRRTRPDGEPKITGRLKYLTDLHVDGMLYGKIKRSEYPHARITGIYTEKAESLPGVKAVITHKDVPAFNGFGIVMPDQPVLCGGTVRYTGDAVAAVAADTIEEAEAAIASIEVTYDPLPIMDAPSKSLEEDAPLLHPEGNILHRKQFRQGCLDSGFDQCSAVVEETYDVSRQMHTYMETEGGVVVPEEDGGISVYMGTQHGFKDRFQLSRILGLEEERIRIVSSPMGGSFGGKDELNVQPYAALLAMKSGCPVHIHQTRAESVQSSIKRHPMKIRMKTGADNQGKLMAHEVEITADTGAYATLGPAILDFAVEHACGPYRIPAVDIQGLSVFTNNGVAGEFRGFGGNQITFALEGQMDRLAEKLHLSPAALRHSNLRSTHDPGPLGQTIAPTDGAVDVLKTLEENPLTASAPKPWKMTGAGIAVTMHGGGLGSGRLDPSGGRFLFTKDGKIEISFGFEEFGQGILGVIETVVCETLGCGEEDIRIRIGDTTKVPPTGSTTASRGTSMVWQAVQRMQGDFRQSVLEKASKVTGAQQQNLVLGEGGIFSGTIMVLSYEELAGHLEEELETTTFFDFPVTPDDVDGSHYLYTFAAVRAEVEVDIRTGQVSLQGLNQAVSAGPVVNEIGYKGQIEGGGVMAAGYALMEEAEMKEGRYVNENLDTYMIPGISDVPFDLGVYPVETLHESDEYGPRGVGEIGTVAVAPAIAKAVHDAVGLWVDRLPIHPERVLDHITKRGLHPWM
ncbi:xanthine dehydrogenase subunit D [Salibacterium lacus]|uniref:Xanthine dehydrogenase subunit D n=1 Tax=Salibacterium lacus TaxID=1898109 RepID=A0ABW5T2C1_9BACI